MRKGLIVKKLKEEKKTRKRRNKEIGYCFRGHSIVVVDFHQKNKGTDAEKEKAVVLHAYPHHFIISNSSISHSLWILSAVALSNSIR